jgi:predicted amidophosphoribosyltransferase
MSTFGSTTCRRCGGRPETEDGYCDRCQEIVSLLDSESLRVSVVCSHCGKTFTEKKFDRHRWSCYYRDRTLVITGRRRRR